MKEVDKKSYELIAEEIDTGDTQKALWTKAFSDAEGDESRTKALYIKYRFKEISNEEQEYHEDEWDDDEDFKTTTGLAKDGYQFNKDKQSDAGIPRAEKSSNSVNSIHSAKEHTGGDGGIELGGFLYGGSIVIGIVTYRLVWFCYRLSQRDGGLTFANEISIYSSLTVILANLYLIYLLFSKSIVFVRVYLINLVLQLGIIFFYYQTIIPDMISVFSRSGVWVNMWVFIYLFYFIFAIYLLVSKRVKQTFVN